MFTVSNVTLGYKKISHNERKLEVEQFKGQYKCNGCKKVIRMGEKYFYIGVRATTLHEKQYAKKGCIWSIWCEECACKPK